MSTRIDDVSFIVAFIVVFAIVAILEAIFAPSCDCDMCRMVD